VTLFSLPKLYLQNRLPADRDSFAMTGVLVVTARCYAERGIATASRLSIRP